MPCVLETAHFQIAYFIILSKMSIIFESPFKNNQYLIFCNQNNHKQILLFVKSGEFSKF